MTKRDIAIDLGSGALNDSKYLLDQGFKHVIALDKEAVAKEIADGLPKEKFTYVISDFETYDFPVGTFDLANAQYSLPFIKPEAFETVFQKIISSVKKNGILVGQLFGNGDEWGNKVCPRPIPAAAKGTLIPRKTSAGNRRGGGANFVVGESAPLTHVVVANSSSPHPPERTRVLSVRAGSGRGILRSYNKKSMNFHTLEEVKALLSTLEILSFTEEDKEKSTATGRMMHWHVFHFIVRK
ncbi:MAG: class I SAM-dependent methyltransferase [Patescibacteria group bacterium]